MLVPSGGHPPGVSHDTGAAIVPAEVAGRDFLEVGSEVEGGGSSGATQSGGSPNIARNCSDVSGGIGRTPTDGRGLATCRPDRDDGRGSNPTSLSDCWPP